MASGGSIGRPSQRIRRLFVLLSSLTLGLALLAFVLYEIERSRTYQVFGEIVPRVNTNVKAVALTFDDGPSSPQTDQILATLAHERVKATFFLIGSEMEQNRDSTRHIAEAGHEIGNHTYRHQRMVLKPMSFYRSEIEKTDALIRDSGYTGPIYFRAPATDKLFGLTYYLRRTHRTTVTWDVEPDSFPEVSQDSNRIVQYVLANARPGSIILLHVMYGGRSTSMDAVPGIIDGLRAKGYEFKTVSELIALADKN